MADGTLFWPASGCNGRAVYAVLDRCAVRAHGGRGGHGATLRFTVHALRILHTPCRHIAAPRGLLPGLPAWPYTFLLPSSCCGTRLFGGGIGGIRDGGIVTAHIWTRYGYVVRGGTDGEASGGVVCTPADMLLEPLRKDYLFWVHFILRICGRADIHSIVLRRRSEAIPANAVPNGTMNVYRYSNVLTSNG